MADISAKQLGLTKSNLPRSILEVIATLTKAGFEAYIVGGGVRDNLLGLDPKDFDAVTNAKPQEIKDVFGKRCRIIGRRFQLAHVYSGKEMIEVATFRGPPKDDSNTTNEGMITRDNVWGDIRQDFSRRDFSINAMYYQPLEGVVKDFCNAVDDIENRTLRLLGHAKTRVEEDPVRLLRALRFKAKLGFEFDEALSEQFNDNNWELLEQVSPHRLYDESQKMFTGGYIVPLLPLLYEYGAMSHLFVYPDKQPSNLVNRIAHNTDKRIALGKTINPAFFYAGLLWNNYLHQLAKNKKRDMPFQEAQQKAATQVINRQRVKTAIPKFSEQFIKDIWLLQPKLANPRAKNIAQVFEHPKFRAGFDFLLLREECGESDTPLAEDTNGMGQWWHDFQLLTEKEQQRAIKRFTGETRRSRKRQGRPEKIYPKKAPRTAEQVAQDSQEKAQLQQLSSALRSVRQEKSVKKRQPLPLFTSNNKSFAADLAKHRQEDIYEETIKSNENHCLENDYGINNQELFIENEDMTVLQEILLDSPRVPSNRRRRDDS